MEKTFFFVTPTNPEELAQFYKDIERYLEPMGTGEWEQLVTFAIMGDSFTNEKRVMSEVRQVPRQHLPMLPHGTKSPRLPEGSVYRTVKVENLSFGGATMETMLEETKAMERWVRDVPALTLLHLGGCDIGYGNISKDSTDGPAKQYKKSLFNFLETWIERATETIEKYSYDNVAIQEKMRERIKVHKWLIVSIPDWGKNCKQVKGVTAQDHVDIRRKCNSALGNTTTYLKTKYNAVVLKTNFERSETNYKNIHLSFEDQKRYNEIIFSVARRLLCDVCSWNPTRLEIQRDRNMCKNEVYGNIPDEILEKLKVEQYARNVDGSISKVSSFN